MVLYSKIRPYLDEGGASQISMACAAQTCIRLRPLPNEITRDYLFHLYAAANVHRLCDPRFGACRHAEGQSRASVRVQGFASRLSKKQKRIVAKLDALREETQRLESIYQRKLAALEALKKSLLHQAFSGQL